MSFTTLVETKQQPRVERTPHEIIETLRMAESVPWETFVNCFTECDRCRCVVLRGVGKQHIYHAVFNRELDRLSTAQRDVVGRITEQAWHYRGLRKSAFGKLFVRCSACNHVVFDSMWTQHGCAESWFIVVS